MAIRYVIKVWKSREKSGAGVVESGSGVPPLFLSGEEAGRLFHFIGREDASKMWLEKEAVGEGADRHTRGACAPRA